MLSRMNTSDLISSIESLRPPPSPFSPDSSSPRATDCSRISAAHSGSRTVSMNTTSAASITAAMMPK